MNKNRKHNDELIEAALTEFAPKYQKKIITKMEISIRIDEARKRNGWTRVELAKKFNKKPSVITKWLSGSHNFTVDTLTEIEEILKINILSLVEKHEIREKSDIQFTSVMDTITVIPKDITSYCNNLMLGFDPKDIQTFRGETKSRA